MLLKEELFRKYYLLSVEFIPQLILHFVELSTKKKKYGRTLIYVFQVQCIYDLEIHLESRSK